MEYCLDLEKLRNESGFYNSCNLLTEMFRSMKWWREFVNCRASGLQHGVRWMTRA